MASAVQSQLPHLDRHNFHVCIAIHSTIQTKSRGIHPLLHKKEPDKRTSPNGSSSHELEFENRYEPHRIGTYNVLPWM